MVFFYNRLDSNLLQSLSFLSNQQEASFNTSPTKIGATINVNNSFKINTPLSGQVADISITN